VTEPTLGDILGSILAGYGIAAEPPPPVSDIEAQAVAASSLSHALARVSDMSVNQVWDCLTSVPDNMLALLHSPQGWTALASLVAADNGLPEPLLMPSIH
jgi:hypothetical protein